MLRESMRRIDDAFMHSIRRSSCDSRMTPAHPSTASGCPWPSAPLSALAARRDTGWTLPSADDVVRAALRVGARPTAVDVAGDGRRLQRARSPMAVSTPSCCACAIRDAPRRTPRGTAPVCWSTWALGKSWDELVVLGGGAQGDAGLECLSGIPGDVGAAPMQNVGAHTARRCPQTIEQRRGVIDRASGWSGSDLDRRGRLRTSATATASSSARRLAATWW